MNLSERDDRVRLAGVALGLAVLSLVAGYTVDPPEEPVPQTFPLPTLTTNTADTLKDVRPGLESPEWGVHEDGREELSVVSWEEVNSAGYAYDSFVKPVHPCCVSLSTDRYDCFFRVVRGTLSHLTQFTDQPRRWENIGGRTIGHIGCQSLASNHILVYALAQNRTLLGRTMVDGVWGDWQQLLNRDLQEIPECSVLSAHTMLCIGRRLDHTPIILRYANGQWKTRNAPRQLLKTQFACVQPIRRNLHCFAAGEDGALKHLPWTAAKLWGSWDSLGGHCSGIPTVVSTASHTMDVFVNNTFGRLSHLHWNGSGWSDWMPYQMWSPVLKTDASCVASVGDRIDCFVGFNPDGRLHRIAWNGQSWSRWKVYTFNIYTAPFCRYFKDGQIWCLIWAKPPKWTVLSFRLIDMPA